MSYNTVLSYNKEVKLMDHFYQTIGEDWFTYSNLYRTMVQKYGEGSHFVEIGSWKGRSAAFMGVEIHNSGYNIKFDCVDTWQGSIEHQDMDLTSLYDDFLNNIKPVASIINPIKTTSLAASTLHKDGSLDFVFIDASHEYDNVLADVKAWLPKVKEGGVLAGHDYGSEGVNRAISEFFEGKNINVSEDCWIYEKPKAVKSGVTIVTGLWNIGRDGLQEGWSRSFEHYLNKLEQLLKTPDNLIIYIEQEYESFIWERRDRSNTYVVIRGLEWFSANEHFFSIIQKIRKDPDWYNQAGWLPQSTQAQLKWYNPIVMSKMFLLNDARIFDPFDSTHLVWVDAALTNTVHEGYFWHDKVIGKLSKYFNKFSFVCFPYDGKVEIHGFTYDPMCKFANGDIDKVARGGIFGGPKESIQRANEVYYNLFANSLEQGYMGTEESLFTIMLYKHPELFQYYEIGMDGLLGTFFDNLSRETLQVKAEYSSKSSINELNQDNTALYVIAFNFPNQFETLCKSFEEYDRNFLDKPRKFLLNNSTDHTTDQAFAELCIRYGFEEIKKDNIGICGGRQFCAEHAEENQFDYYFFFEDDMFFYNGKDEFCRNGFRRKISDFYNIMMQIMHTEQFDFLKWNFSELFGDNRKQWAWHNIPGHVREELFPDAPVKDSNDTEAAPHTKFENIKSYRGVPYAIGDVFYCNWPQVVSRVGNKKMFLDTKWAHPYEQTWMSYIYQETRKELIKPGILLATPTEHNRFEHYSKEERREN
jgi:hypothetical protein